MALRTSRRWGPKWILTVVVRTQHSTFSQHAAENDSTAAARAQQPWKLKQGLRECVADLALGSAFCSASTAMPVLVERPSFATRFLALWHSSSTISTSPSAASASHSTICHSLLGTQGGSSSSSSSSSKQGVEVTAVVSVVASAFHTCTVGHPERACWEQAWCCLSNAACRPLLVALCNSSPQP